MLVGRGVSRSSNLLPPVMEVKPVYKLSRLILLAAVAVYGYYLVLLMIFSFTVSPAFGWGMLFIGFAALARMRKKIAPTLNAHGTRAMISARCRAAK
jgi:hypothetical protein